MGGYFHNHPDYVAFGRVQQKPLGAALTENDVRFGKIDRRKEAMVTACFYDACGVPDVESFGARGVPRRSGDKFRVREVR